jgi:hypothetical protein
MASYISIAREQDPRDNDYGILVGENDAQKFFRVLMWFRGKGSFSASDQFLEEDIAFLYTNKDKFSLYQKSYLFFAPVAGNQNNSIHEYARENSFINNDGTVNKSKFTEEYKELYLDFGAAYLWTLSMNQSKLNQQEKFASFAIQFLPFVEGEISNRGNLRDTFEPISVNSLGVPTNRNRPWEDYNFLSQQYSDNRGADISRSIEDIVNVYVEFGADAQLLIAGGSSTIKQFSYNNFLSAISDSLNADLETGGAYENVELRSFEVPRKLGDNYVLNDPIGDKLASVHENKISEAEKKILEENFLSFPDGVISKADKLVNYKFPIPGRPDLENTVTFSGDLSSLESTKGEDTSWYNVDNKSGSKFVKFYKPVYQTLIEESIKNLVFDSGASNYKALSGFELPNYNYQINLDKTKRLFFQKTKEVAEIEGLPIAKLAVARLIYLTFSEFVKLAEKGEATIEDLTGAFLKAEASVKADEKLVGEENPEDQLTEEEIKARQKFLKQCMLMTNLSSLVDENIEFIKHKKSSVHSKVPYGHRFYMIDDATDRSSIMNKLVIPSGETLKGFLDIKPHEHASLVPKLRFFKVTKDKDSEFKFPNVTSKKRIEALKSTVFDRGSDFGVKEFSFSFEGTNPATAKNDIKADLTLYFQSFKDFVEKKSFNDGKSYVELLLLPGGKKKGEVSGVSSPLHYAPSDYRIRVDVGWMLESAPNESIKKALKKINKSFYLNMIDHSIDFKNDGSVEIKVTYRAYLETQLKGSTLDALSSYDSRESLEELNEVYRKIVNSNNCTAEELTQIRAQFLELEEGLRKQTYQSILKRLLDRGLIRRKIVDEAASSRFIESGIFPGKVAFLPAVDSTAPSSDEERSSKASVKTVDIKKGKDIRNDKDTYNLNYFYLGDLLYVVMDCLYEKNTNKYREDVQNFKFILSTFDYMDPFEKGTTKNINIANIPISVELFFEWITENVVKKDRASYPVLYFIRDITKYLITEILLENCFNFSLEKSMEFKTTNFIGLKNKQGDPLASLATSESPVIDVTDNYKKENSVFPLNADSEKTPQTKDFINYLVLYPQVPRLRDKKVGVKKVDQENGVLHFQVGRDRGLVKTIKFSKTDMQYIREARFFRNGHDGLMQLSAVYKAGEGERTIANKLGFGGYHLITRVNSSIGPGKFTTTVDAMFDYAGDGDPRSRVIGRGDEIKDVPDLKDLEKRPAGGNKDYCEAVINSVFNQSVDIANGTQSKFELTKLEDSLTKAGLSLDDANYDLGASGPLREKPKVEVKEVNPLEAFEGDRPVFERETE